MYVTSLVSYCKAALNVSSEYQSLTKDVPLKNSRHVFQMRCLRFCFPFRLLLL